MVIGRVFVRGFQSDGLGDTDGNVMADFVELGQDILLDGRVDVAGLEADGINEELLLDWAQRVVEQTGLRPVVAESRRALADEVAGHLTPRGSEETPAVVLRSLLRVAAVEGVWRVLTHIQVSQLTTHRHLVRISYSQATVFL
jgi:hypothetical protein